MSAAAIAAYADVNPNLAGIKALAAKEAVFFGWNGGIYIKNPKWYNVLENSFLANLIVELKSVKAIHPVLSKL